MSWYDDIIENLFFYVFEGENDIYLLEICLFCEILYLIVYKIFKIFFLVFDYSFDGELK